MKDDILHKVMAVVNELPLIRCELAAVEKGSGDELIALSYKGGEQLFRTEVKRQIVPAQVPSLIQSSKLGDGPLMLMATYISDKARALLRNEGVAYADEAGNVFMSVGKLYAFVETGKNGRRLLPQVGRAFNKTGLKVIYQFLLDRALINKPYRQIGERSSVTIDTVGKVVKELLGAGYVLKLDPHKYQWIDRKRLFDNWVTAFNSVLRPRLLQARYRPLDNPLNWLDLKLPLGSSWGGAVAVERLELSLIADRAIVYTSGPFLDHMKAMKLVPDEEGMVSLYQKFWKEEEEAELVSPFLIYADLIHEGTARYIETASKLYDEQIERYL